MVSLVAPRSLDYLNTASAVTQSPEQDRGSTVVDLSRTHFIDAYGLVAVACQIEYAIEHELEVELTPPSGDALVYMSRMGIGDLLDVRGIDNPFPHVRRRDLQDRLCELSDCRAEADFGRLADMAYNRMASGEFDAELPDIVAESIMELGNNVIEHSGSGRGFLAAQTFREGSPGAYMVFAVGDVGTGLRPTLEAVYTIASDTDALELAVQEGASGTGDPARGVGLSTLVERSGEMAGRTRLSSGTGTLLITPTVRRIEDVSHIQGTLIGCRIDCRPGT